MKIFIASDTHGHLTGLSRALKIENKEKEIDLFIHCGDLGVDVREIRDMIDCPSHFIAGNNDFFTQLPREEKFSIGKYSVLLTHGHNYGVGLSINRLAYLALQEGINIVMFGHTHVPVIEHFEGVWLVNPGSLTLPRQSNGRPSYIIMDVSDLGGVNFEIKYL